MFWLDRQCGVLPVTSYTRRVWRLDILSCRFTSAFTLPAAAIPEYTSPLKYSKGFIKRAYHVLVSCNKLEEQKALVVFELSQ
jgi:hypothetical protein